MSSQLSYGDGFGKRFGAKTAPAFVTQTLRKSEIAVTYLRQEQPTFELSEPQPIHDAYLVSLGWGDFPKYRLWENGRAINTEPVFGGQITFYDLKAKPSIHVNSPMIGLHFHIPHAAFDAIADNIGVPRIGGLKYPRGHGVDDSVMRGLSMALMPAFENPDRASRLFVDYVTLAAATHVARTYGSMASFASKRGGLAAWQEKRATELLDQHIDGEISQAQLAQECGLSPSHFARAFRASTGMAPHQWLLHRRVDKAKDMLRDARLSLADVALACGFADQSHFTRVFSRITDVSPGVWRRDVTN